MEFSMILAQQVLVMFLLLLAGMILYRCQNVRDNAVGQLTNMVLYLVAPFLILKTYQMEYDPQLTKNLLLGFLLSALSIGIGIVISMIMRWRGNPLQVPTERFTIIFTNCGFMGIPLVSAVFGDMGVVYCTTYLTMFNLLVWTYGLVLMKGKDKKAPLLTRLKPFLTPTMVCIVLGIGMYFLQLRLPKPVEEAVTYIASMNTPLAMLVSGMYIVRSGVLSSLKNSRLYLAMLVKCFLVPLAVLAVLYVLPLDNTLRMTILIASACPTAANSILFADRFGGDERFASHMFALSTLVSIVSIPAVIFLATGMIK